MELSIATVQTSFGPLGIAWTDKGLRRIQLPSGTVAETLRLLRGELAGTPARPPAKLARAIEKLVAHLGGAPQRLEDVPLDMDGLPEFQRRVYQAARSVPAGRTVTYGELAERTGSPGAARAVGQALAKNPFPLVVPCHRIVAANGAGGFSAPGGLGTKARLLALEGVALRRPPGADAGQLFDGGGRLAFDAAHAVRRLGRADPVLGRLARRVGPFRLRPDAASGSFAALAQSIAHQQLTGKAAETILDRFRALVPGKPFPEPSDVVRLPEEKLRSVGFSGSKVAALRDLAEKALDGTVPPLSKLARMDDEAIVERLTRVRGIGRWTVEMLLIFRLGRPDVLPVDDYGVRKGFAQTFGLEALPAPKELARHGERWRPYRSVASWYLWRALELAPR